MLNVKNIRVSVSLRSIIHSYETGEFIEEAGETKKFPSPYGVSFILILAPRTIITATIPIKVSVSLLSIIHSHRIWDHQIKHNDGVSFRLLTEYHSFL